MAKNHDQDAEPRDEKAMSGRSLDVRSMSLLRWMQPRALGRHHWIFLSGMDGLSDDCGSAYFWGALSSYAIQD